MAGSERVPDDPSLAMCGSCLKACVEIIAPDTEGTMRFFRTCATGPAHCDGFEPRRRTDVRRV